MTKCAVVTEEQVKTIEDALTGEYSGDVEEALAIIKSLKLSEPVALASTYGAEMTGNRLPPMTPLYAKESE